MPANNQIPARTADTVLGSPPAPEMPVASSTARSRPRDRRREWGMRAAEVLAGPIAAGLLLLLCSRIQVDPLDRTGQISALAAIGLRFLVLALAVVALLLAAERWRADHWSSLAGRLACAATAGLATGFIGSGVLVALDGTSWPLFADRGDAGTLVAWVEGLMAGESMPASYPPLAVHAMAWYAELTGSSAEASFKALQIVGTAVSGPVVYLAWRLLLRSAWALTAAVVSSSVLIDPYKPYGPLVLAVLVPVLLLLLREVRRAPGRGWAALAGRGAGLGVALGLLFLTYSGWFVWSALGAVAAVALVLPWRRGLFPALAFLGSAAAVFAGVAFVHLVGLLRASESTKDTYFYFDVFVEPAYIAMWRGDLPGPVGVWPPPGELGGVGLFSLVLVLGLGVAVWLAGRSTAVIGLTMLLVGAWVMRFWFAQQMFETQAVQLYPRTTQQILYCSLLLVGCAVYAAGHRARSWWPVLSARPAVEGAPSPAGERRAAVPATVIAVLAFALFAGSATADRFMPRSDGTSVGFLAYVAQMVRQPDGRCAEHARENCAETSTELVEGEFEKRTGTP